MKSVASHSPQVQQEDHKSLNAKNCRCQAQESWSTLSQDCPCHRKYLGILLGWLWRNNCQWKTRIILNCQRKRASTIQLNIMEFLQHLLHQQVISLCIVWCLQLQQIHQLYAWKRMFDQQFQLVQTKFLHQRMWQPPRPFSLPLHSHPILLSLVWLQIKLDCTQSYYHNDYLYTVKISFSINKVWVWEPGLKFWNQHLLWIEVVGFHPYWEDFSSSSSVSLSPEKPMVLDSCVICGQWITLWDLPLCYMCLYLFVCLFEFFSTRVGKSFKLCLLVSNFHELTCYHENVNLQEVP